MTYYIIIRTMGYDALARAIMKKLQRSVSGQDWSVKLNDLPVMSASSIISSDWDMAAVNSGSSYSAVFRTREQWLGTISDETEHTTFLIWAGETPSSAFQPFVQLDNQNFYWLAPRAALPSANVDPSNTQIVLQDWSDERAVADLWFQRWLQDIVAFGATRTQPQDNRQVVSQTKKTDIATLASTLTINPVHVLREILTNNGWGFGIDETSIDEDSFLEAAIICYTEKIGFSYANIGNLNAIALVNLLKEHIECEVYYNYNTGKVHINLIREIADRSSLPHLNESNVSNMSYFQRNYNTNPVTSVTIEYQGYDGSSQSYTVVAPSHLSQGEHISAQYPGCPDERTAQTLADRELSVLNNSPLALSVDVSATTASSLWPGDAVRLTWYPRKLQEELMRVVSKVVNSDETVTIHLTEDIFTPPLENTVKAQLPVAVVQAARGWGFNWAANWGGN